MIDKAFILENKFILIGIGLLTLYYAYTKFSISKSTKSVKDEYNQLLTSEEYKVKSQFD